MSTFLYSQELRRTIRLFGSFAVAFSFISITTGLNDQCLSQEEVPDSSKALLS